MLFREKHALGLYADDNGWQLAWLVATSQRTLRCVRSWCSPNELTPLEAAALRREAAWPRRCGLAVTLPDVQAVRVTVSLAPGLSWRDRRFQQMTEVLLQFPHLGEDVLCDEDSHGTVFALPRAALLPWQHIAKAMGARLQWVGLAHALSDAHRASEVSRPDIFSQSRDWRWAQAEQHSPLALQAAQAVLTQPHGWWAHDALRPNWAIEPWRRWLAHLGRQHSLWFLSCWRATGLTWRQCVHGICAGALLVIALMHGLQALGEARDVMNHTDARMRQLQHQHDSLLHAKAQQDAAAQAARTQAAQRDQALHALRIQSQASVQWMQVLLHAQGVWLQRVALHGFGANGVGANGVGANGVDAQGSAVQGSWQLQGEALSPAHAQSLREALQALPGWRKPPSEYAGQWLHGQDRRLSVWAFELRASLDRPW